MQLFDHDDLAFGEEVCEVFTKVMTYYAINRRYPAELAAQMALDTIDKEYGIDIRRLVDWNAIHEKDEPIFDVFDLSVQFHLEHDGSALNQLLEKYDYQRSVRCGWQRFWLLTTRAKEEAVGFVHPWQRGRNCFECLRWKPQVVHDIIALERMEETLKNISSPLLQRHYFTPRELAQMQELPCSTRRINVLLKEKGLQTRDRRRKCWTPTRDGQRWSIWMPTGYEWKPDCVEPGPLGSETKDM